MLPLFGLLPAFTLQQRVSLSVSRKRYPGRKRWDSNRKWALLIYIIKTFLSLAKQSGLSCISTARTRTVITGFKLTSLALYKTSSSVIFFSLGCNNGGCGGSAALICAVPAGCKHERNEGRTSYITNNMYGPTCPGETCDQGRQSEIFTPFPGNVCQLTGSTNSNFFLSCTSWILKTYCSDAS